jgi:uncharacterized protein involved in exopolysaccharide biosynthesis
MPFALEQDIDLRETLRLLARKWWLVLGLPLILAIVTVLIVKFILPRQYQATALVLITKPTLTTNFDPRLEANPQVPEAQLLSSLALSDDTLLEVLQAPEIATQVEDEWSVSTLREMLDTATPGLGQIRLVVNAADPIQAAEIANIWAEKLAERLNDLYSTSEASLKQIEAQQEIARANWEQAEQVLLEQLDNYPVDALAIRLDRARNQLASNLDRLRDLELIIGDAKNLGTRLQSQNGGSPLRVEDALSLIALYQRAAGESANLQFQVSGTQVLGNETTVASTRNNLSAFYESLETQQAALNTRRESLEQEISQLATALETAQFKKAQLTVERDLALSAYQALSAQAEEARITLSQNNQTAKIAGRALPPTLPSGPRALLYGAIIGFAAVLFVITLVLGWQWWQAGGRRPD